MALRIPEAPAESRLSLTEGMQRMSGHPSAASALGGQPLVSDPQQVFSIGLDDLAQGSTLEAARGVGWRYLLTQPPAAGGAPIAAAEVNQVGDQHRFSQLHRGWLSQETRKTIDIAQGLPEVAAGDYELRALRVPALLVDAIWLKDRSGNNDLVLPIRSSVTNLTDGQVYKASDFINWLRDAAARKSPFNDRPQRR